MHYSCTSVGRILLDNVSLNLMKGEEQERSFDTSFEISVITKN